jgi:hypothetical protein
VIETKAEEEEEEEEEKKEKKNNKIETINKTQPTKK